MKIIPNLAEVTEGLKEPCINKIIVPTNKPTNITGPVLRQKNCCYANERHVSPPPPMGGRGFRGPGLEGKERREEGSEI